MDWFERWFGIALDHGNGSLEAFALTAIVVALGVAAFAARRPVRAWLAR